MSGRLKSPVCIAQLTGLKSERNTDSLQNTHQTLQSPQGCWGDTSHWSVH